MGEYIIGTQLHVYSPLFLSLIEGTLIVVVLPDWRW